MNPTNHDVYHEHRWDVEPFQLVTPRPHGVTWEVTEVRATISDDEYGLEHHEDIDFYGYPLRKDGQRAATVLMAKLIVGIPYEKRLDLEAQVHDWLGIEVQP